MAVANITGAGIIASMQRIVGGANVLTDDAGAAYLCEPRGRVRGCATCVVRPGNVEEVVAIMHFAHQHTIAVLPQSGNTGLVCGQVATLTRPAIVLSLTRMRAMRRISADNNTMTVEAGMTLEAAQQVARDHDRLFPLTLASQGSCCIGGNIATNAGGTGVLAYGNMRDLVLGLEVVLANGNRIDGLRTLIKDNAGYDLKHLFIGSEGTLGVITAASLKLFPRPMARVCAFIAIDSPARGLKVFLSLKSTFGPQLSAFELMSRMGLDFVLTHVPGARAPLQVPCPWFVLCELSIHGSVQGVTEALETALAEALAQGEILDAAIAQSQAQRDAFWSLRENMPEVQKREGASIKHDVSVPLHHLPALISAAQTAIETHFHGCRPVIFGHMGDGNVHLNVSQPIGGSTEAFMAQQSAINAVVHDLVVDLGGSIAAEHGIGRFKAPLLAKARSDVEISLMRAIKAALDPHNLMNPGCLLA